MLWFLSQTLRFFTVVYREALQSEMRRLVFSMSGRECVFSRVKIVLLHGLLQRAFWMRKRKHLKQGEKGFEGVYGIICTKVCLQVDACSFTLKIGQLW